MQNMTMDKPRRRPGGVTIIAVLLGIEGILEVIAGILLLTAFLFISHRVTVHGHTTVATVINVLGGILGGPPLIIGILTLIFTWGLWMLKRWAYWTTIVIAVLNILVALPPLFQSYSNIPSFVFRLIILIVPIVILLYFLFFPQVRHAFRT